LKSVEIDELSVARVKHCSPARLVRPDPLPARPLAVTPTSKACNIGANKAVNCRSEADPAAAMLY